MSVEYEYATEKLIVAKHERTLHLAALLRGEDDDAWAGEFTRLQAVVREAIFDQAVARLPSRP